jgi:hypothetical protein
LRSKTTEQQNKRKDRDAARTKWKRNARGDQIIPFREEKLDICKAITSLRVFESACSRNFCGRMPNLRKKNNSVCEMTPLQIDRVFKTPTTFCDVHAFFS